MRMCVRCEGCGLEYAGARGLGGLFAAAAQPARGRATCAMLAEVRALPPARAPGARHGRARGRRSPSGAFLAVGGYSRYFTEHFVLPLVSAVWSCAPETVVAELPGALPVPLPGPPRAAGGQRLAAVADGGRRLAQLRRARGRSSSPRSARRHPGPGGAPRPPTASRSATTPTVAHRFDRGRGGHPPGPGAALLRRPHRRRARGARARSATPATRPCCTPTPRCCPAGPAARASWNYLMAACSTPARPGAGQLRHEPAAAAGRPRTTTSSP